MRTINRETIYNWGWQANNSHVNYTYLDTVNNKERSAFISDRICYQFERTRKRINPKDNINIQIEPFIYFEHNGIKYRTPF